MFNLYAQALSDPKLIIIIALSALVTFFSGNTIASRPAAVITRRVAIANSFYSIFFTLTRFANLFYLPLLATQVDRAAKTGNIALLDTQLRLILWGSFLGGGVLWIFLPTFIQLFSRGIRSFEARQSMIRVLLQIFKPKIFRIIFESLRKPETFGVSLFNLEGVPAGFLIFNVIATGIWTTGVLCALFVSAKHPEFARTAVLLSGLVNAFAAIIFSTLVDPKAALITDQVIAGERPEKHVYVTCVFLCFGNLIGLLLSQLIFIPGSKLIESSTFYIGNTVGEQTSGLMLVILLSVFVTALSSTTVVSRISAAITLRVATAFAIYNLFFLITRLAQQIYAPIIGTIVDTAMKTNSILRLQFQLRLIILGATLGTLIGWLLMPTFVEIYKKGINGMEKFGSLPKLIINSFNPKYIKKWIECLRKPSLMGVTLKSLNEIPKTFIYANVIVISIYTVGVLCALYSSAVNSEYARQTTLLSSVVNGVATILIALIVDPMSSLITDQAVAGERPLRHVKIMAVFLIAGMFAGTLISQLIFLPASEFIIFCSRILSKVF